MAASRYSSLALSADGSVWSWGWVGWGKLGHGDEEDQWQPKKVEAFAGQRIVAVSSGYSHSLALTADGAVWSWGEGGYGQLGHGNGHGNEQAQLLPKKIEAFADQHVAAVSAACSLAITADGAIWSWCFGDFGLGQLGHGDNQNQLLPMKAEAFAWQRVVAVSAGDRHSLAITADGALWSWGGGAFGCLGHGNEQSQLLPKKVEALAGRRVVALSAELDADGAVFTWGAGGLGRLGHGEDLSNQLLPKKVEAPSRE